MSARDRLARLKWHLPLSLLLHAVLLAVFLFRQPASTPQSVEDRPIRVEIVAAAPPEKRPKADGGKIASRPGTAVLTPDKIISAGRRNLPEHRHKPKQEIDDADAMISARQVYSAAALADRRSAKARIALRGLGTDERIIQLCDIEAMEQVHRWKAEFAPDAVVAYATENVKRSEHGLDADGAALHSHGNWFSMRFTCDVSPDGETVLAFAFRVGELIPQANWSDYNLASDVGASD